MARDLAARLMALLDPLAVSHGLELVAAEVVGPAKSPVVRIYLDRDGGIDLDVLTSANRWVSEALDNVADLTAAYTLEVSSPGIERPLVKRSDWERFTGQRAAIKVAPAVNGRSSFTGTITGLERDDVLIEVASDIHRVPLASVTRARLKVDFEALGEGNTR
jgi:ribosome maturation factor RimP